MYLPRDLFANLYTHLVRSHHPQSPPVLILVALEPDALCACRILTALLKRDFVPHNIVPVAGYADLTRVGESRIRPLRRQDGGEGGTVICLGVGGLVDLSSVLGLDATAEDPDGSGGVTVWVIDARRPWNLGNVFGGRPFDPSVSDTSLVRRDDVVQGQIQRHYRPGAGGIIVFDDGDITAELDQERQAYFKLESMPDVDDDGNDSVGSSSDSDGDDEPYVNGSSRKRKSWSDRDDEDEDQDQPPRRRQRSSSATSSSTHRSAKEPALHISSSRSPSPRQPPPPSHQPQTLSPRRARRRLLRLRRKTESILLTYYGLGTSYAEPISSILYSLASELGHEDNNTLWHAIVGIASLEVYGRTLSNSQSDNALGWVGARAGRIQQLLRDEVRRLNPPGDADMRKESTLGESSGIIPTTANSPNDHSIRLSPEPRFLLIRHWSLYDSMLHSPYLASKLHLWNEIGRKRLAKLLAKMGVSLTQSRQSYTHMDMELKRSLRAKLLKYAPQYGLDGLIPPPSTVNHGKEGWGFVKTWGWKACLSAVDVASIIGAILEVGKGVVQSTRNADQGPVELVDEEGRLEGEEYVGRFWEAYDALENVAALTHALPTTQHLHRAILRTGSALISKSQIRHLHAFRMAVVREGPDVQLFTHPGALTKLALWIGDAVAEAELEKHSRRPKRGRTPFVLAAENKDRGVYIVVGTGGGRGVAEKESWTAKEDKKKAKEKRKAEKIATKEKAKQEWRAKRAVERARRAEDDDDDEEDEEEEEGPSESDKDSVTSSSEDEEQGTRKRSRLNRFGNAFQEVVDETNARVRIDSFEHSVVEVKKDDLSQFLTALSTKAVLE